eukprot:778222-Prymnesium_polylepis.1
MSTNDLAVQLHFALFNGSSGFLLKPLEMRVAGESANTTNRGQGTEASPHFELKLPAASTASRETCDERGARDRDFYWPPPREMLHCSTVEILSLHKYAATTRAVAVGFTHPLNPATHVPIPVRQSSKARRAKAPSGRDASCMSQVRSRAYWRIGAPQQAGVEQAKA